MAATEIDFAALGIDTEKATYIYDKLAPKVRQAVETQYVFKKFQKMVSDFADKNTDVLQTNILGKQLLFSQKLQDDILELYNIDKEEVRQLMSPKATKYNYEITSPYFIERGDLSLLDQLMFCIPIEIISSLYLEKRKEDEAAFVYMTMFFKPYATRISHYFKYGVNVPQMLYTIEHMNERFDLKREGTIFNLITKKAMSSFNNYKKTLVNHPTDKDLYVIATGGCYTRMNTVVKETFAIYSQNAGKRLSFEVAYTEVDGDDGEGRKTIDNEIQSEAAIRNSIAKKTISTLTKIPVNERFLKVAVQRSFGSFSLTNMRVMTNAINEIIDKKFMDLPELIDMILSSFSHQINGTTKKKFRAEDIRTPMFITASLKIFKSPNTKDPATLRARELVGELLEACSDDYLKFETSYKRYMKNAFYFYLLLVINKG